ncbi:3364_t:CDS:2 [Funneliformis geosporum]|nr:3364_t:CDS:2 [Funneliformis geosporum]
MTEKKRNKLLRERFKNETNPQVLERMETKTLISSRESLINSSLAKELDKLFFYSFELEQNLGYEDEEGLSPLLFPFSLEVFGILTCFSLFPKGKASNSFHSFSLKPLW